MERLTISKHFGEHARFREGAGCRNPFEVVVDRLAEYEDTGLTPEEIKDILSVLSENQDDVDEDGISMGLIHELLELARYRQAEEQGLLIRLPYKVGDTVFRLCDIGHNRHAKEMIVKEIAIRYSGSDLVSVIILAFGPEHQYKVIVTQNEFGKTVFLTREEAEEALKGGERE